MKKRKTYKGRSLKPGGGGRFRRLTDKLRRQGKTASQARGIAAKQGRRKYGKKKMAAWAARGRRRKEQ